ncbi:MAG TPA: ATP-binding protein, partial [Anaeromyxobacteraceae bacterium]|nr:ATP-binding protein [Anaeromyxobacteraceae bacterium]
RAGNLGLWDLDLATGDVWRTVEHDRIFGYDEPPARWTQADALRHVVLEDRPGLRKVVDAAMISGKLHATFRILDAKGRERWVEEDARVLRDESGNPVRIAGSLADVTERMRAEERIRALQERLALSSRLAALGTLVAGVAHEINNPLAAELANQGLALEVARTVRERLRGGAPFDPVAKAGMLDEAVEALQDAQEAGLRIAGIVKDMAALVSVDPKRTRVRLADVVAEALRQLPAKVVPEGAVQVEDRGAPDVLAASGQIAQVVVNLVTNAARATPAGTRADIRVRIGPGAPGMARLEVIDHGVGIDPAVRDRIFDPFFTTRPAGEARGRGLGLAICQAIVMTHGGALTAESEVAKGSTFRVELPAAPAGA